MPSAFPAELVDLIVSFLHPVPLKRGNGNGNFLDRSTAVAVGRCALVCRAWVPSSRSVLFYRVHVYQSRAHRFATLFRRPNLNRLTFVPFIRELSFPDCLFRNRWMVTVLPKIVQHLSGPIHSLRYRSRWVASPHYPLPCPKLRHITHLDIFEGGEMNFPEVFQCIASFSALQALKLWVRKWIEMPKSLPSTASPPDTLRALNLNFYGLDLFLSWIHTRRLPIHTLALFFPESGEKAKADAAYVVKYTTTLRVSLASLSIGLNTTSPCIDDINPFLDVAFLRANTQLRTLSIQCTAKQMISLLGAMQGPSTLECLKVALHAPHKFEMLAAALDSFVSRHAVMKRLDLVHLIYSWLPPTKRDLASPLEPMMLPLCAEQGVIVEETRLEDMHLDWTRDD
ncbi:hypothetical protein DFH06DRAFT_1483832 [Mycena polygramma]|nr:hypothetical protein DFH06DRAFT_1483832 [Mycena polygramma]